MGQLAMIVAASSNDVIGIDGDLPWHLSEDLKRFKRLTMGHAMIMGRKTFESIGRILPGRTTVIVTRQRDFAFDGAVVVHSWDAAMQATAGDSTPFVVGGAEIYRIALPQVQRLYLTRVAQDLNGDTYLPKIDWGDWRQVKKSDHQTPEPEPIFYSFEDYERNC